MEFFDEIWQIINEENIAIKFDRFYKFYEIYKITTDINFSSTKKPEELKKPCYEAFCNVVSMRNLNKKVAQKDKNLNFIHSVAHIEFSAIDIALDECYRFRDMPRAFYDDWLCVADDEIRHFLMIEELLKEQGVSYGHFVVHDGLFVALQKTQDSLVARMALLPRYMEANGLDANAHIIARLKEQSGNERLVGVLEVILHDEISHVKKGDIWFKYACKMQNINPNEYINIVRSLYPNSFATSRNLNEKARLEAGFDKSELELIKSLAR